VTWRFVVFLGNTPVNVVGFPRAPFFWRAKRLSLFSHYSLPLFSRAKILTVAGAAQGPPPAPIPLNKHKTRDQVFPTVEQHDMSGNAQHPVYPFQPRLLFLEGHHPITRQKKKPTTTTTTLFLSLPPINYI